MARYVSKLAYRQLVVARMVADIQTTSWLVGTCLADRQIDRQPIG